MITRPAVKNCLDFSIQLLPKREQKARFILAFCSFCIYPYKYTKNKYTKSKA